MSVFIPPYPWQPNNGQEMQTVYDQWMQNMAALSNHYEAQFEALLDRLEKAVERIEA